MSAGNDFNACVTSKALLLNCYYYFTLNNSLYRSTITLKAIYKCELHSGQSFKLQIPSISWWIRGVNTNKGI